MNPLFCRPNAAELLLRTGLLRLTRLSPCAHRLERSNRIGDVAVTALTSKVAADIDLGCESRPARWSDDGQCNHTAKGF